MPNSTGNRPSGRQRVGGGAGKSVSTHGSGLGTGPVGKSDGYAGRQGGATPPPSSGGERSAPRGGRGKLIFFIIIILLVVFIGGKLLSGNHGITTEPTPSQAQLSNYNSAALGSFGGNSSYSGGWALANKTGQLNKEVDPLAREKRTVLKGDGTDKVTLMVYLCGTDLETKSGMASGDLKEMASASLSDKVDILVYTGGCRGWKTSGISNTVNQIYKVEPNGRLRLLESNRGSGSMTSPETLTDFIKYCKQNYPANRNELILWDHGGGTVSGFGYDEKNKNAGSMSLVNIAKAVKDSNMYFDFIGFDACLMATLETALVLEPYADYLIASEETEPGIGWYYTNWLNQLNRNPAIPTTELGKLIIDDFISACAQKCPGQKATLSIIDLAELAGTVKDKLASFSETTASQITGEGYNEVSKARANTKEFAASNKIDQVDLVHLALNLNTKESKALANTLLSAVKYNKTASCVTNAYGISAYFPYRSTNRVGSAVRQLDAIGFDSDYTECVKKFASLEVTGQAAGGGNVSPYGSLFGSTGTSSSQAQDPTAIIGSLLGGGSSSTGIDIVSLLGGSGLFDRSFTQKELTDLVDKNALTEEDLLWVNKGGEKVLDLDEEKWELISDIQLNVFLDDGSGYIDLGLDNIFNWTDDGNLIGEYDGMWLAINDQPVAYYFTDTVMNGDKEITKGRIPVLLNGERAELIVSFEGNTSSVIGARFIYANGETETVAKSFTELKDGDVIQPICDRYTYSGDYDDTYKLGDEIIVDGELKISDVTLDPNDGEPIASYVLTDRFAAEHWTAEIK